MHFLNYLLDNITVPIYLSIGVGIAAITSFLTAFDKNSKNSNDITENTLTGIACGLLWGIFLPIALLALICLLLYGAVFGFVLLFSLLGFWTRDKFKKDSTEEPNHNISDRDKEYYND